MKIPEEGHWIARTVNRLARTYFKEMKRAMERHELGTSTLVTMLIVVLLLGSCGALDNTSGSSGNSTNFAGQRVQVVGSSALLPLATKAAALFQQQYPGSKNGRPGRGKWRGIECC